jgi:hypothetical protein
MQSPLRPRNVIIFLLINVLISAVSAFIVVRGLTQSANRSLSAPSPARAAPLPTAVAGGGEAAAGVATEPVVDVPAEVATPLPVEETQEAIGMIASPEATLTAPPTIPSTPTAAPEPANVRISTVVYPGQRTREAVVIVNEGEQVNMTGWTLANQSGQVYTFGNVLLFKDSFINLHTTSGVDVPTDLFWNLDQAVWKVGDLATLKRGDEVMATFAVQ